MGGWGTSVITSLLPHISSSSQGIICTWIFAGIVVSNSQMELLSNVQDNKDK
jgi:hypothetical protein